MKSLPRRSEANVTQIHTKVKLVKGISTLDAMMRDILTMMSAGYSFRNSWLLEIWRMPQPERGQKQCGTVWWYFQPLVPRTFVSLLVNFIIQCVCDTFIPCTGFHQCLELLQNRCIQNLNICVDSKGSGTATMSAYHSSVHRCIMATELVVLFGVTNKKCYHKLHFNIEKLPTIPWIIVPSNSMRGLAYFFERSKGSL